MLILFMGKIIDFVKRNWLVTLMGLVIIFLLLRNNLGIRSTVQMPSSIGGVAMDYAESLSVSPSLMKSNSTGGYGYQPAPTEGLDRMVIENTNMSILVKDVAEALSGIEKQTVTAGGYMVNKSISKPEGAANGSISVRVPVEKREAAMEGFRALGVKVVSENVTGHDVTDQYVDIEARIASLNKTKAKIEGLQEQATRVTDLMEIQRQLTNIEQQIDSYKGSQKYLEQTAKLTLISINLSTDELALPYAPDKAWRPVVVFKSAVRSLVGTLREFGSLIIWLVVYAPVWGAIIGAVLLFKKIKARNRVVMQ